MFIKHLYVNVIGDIGRRRQKQNKLVVVFAQKNTLWEKILLWGVKK